jgi:hypothetical protein
MQNVNLPRYSDDLSSVKRKRAISAEKIIKYAPTFENKRTLSLERDIVRLEKFGTLSSKIKGVKSINEVYMKSIGISRSGKHEDGKVKSNQDCYLVLNNIFEINNFNVYAMLDGHGKFDIFNLRYEWRYDI